MYKPIFTITAALLNQVAEIEALRAKSEQSYILPEREIEMRYRATVEATHDSTSIEGNPLTLKQVGAVLSGTVSTRHKYAETEVKNYKKALDHIEKRKASRAAITQADLLKLHALAMKGLLPKEKAGAYRKGDIYIVNQDEQVKYTGPPAEEVQKLMHDLFNWLAAEGAKLHPCVAAAILHYQFVAIHPFSDGNGRVARLLVLLYIGMCDYDFRGAIPLDSYYSSEKSEYYAALHRCQGAAYNEAADITSWIEYFAGGFLSSAKVLYAEILLLSVLAPALEKQRIGQDDADILSYATQFGSISLSEAADICPDISRRTLQRKLSGMAKNGILTVKGAGKNTRYFWRK